MTILLDENNKYLSMSSGGFPDKTLNTREYNGDVPVITEDEEKDGIKLKWDDENKILIKEAK